LRTCDNCGFVTGEAFCPSCGKPFPPPVPGELRQDQVEFEPENRVQYSAAIDPEEAYRQQGLRYRGGTEIRFEPEPGETAVKANVIGLLSMILAFFGGVVGLVLGIIAVYLGKDAQRRGLKHAETAVTVGYVGIVLSIINIMVLVLVLVFLPSA
jgi:hypothetical protein